MRVLRFWWLPPLLLMVIIATSICGIALTHYGPADFDAPLLLWFRISGDTGRLAGPEWTTAFWLGLTWLGDTTPRLVVVGLTIVVLLLRCRWHSTFFIVGVLLSGVTLSTTIKHWVGRPRPQLVAHLDHVSSQSFPSGHTVNSTLFYLTVALMLASLLPQRATRWIIYMLAISLSLAIGISRIALGVHWPSDVLASWVIACAWLSLWVVVARHYWPKAFS